MPALNTNDYAYIIPPSAQFRDLNGKPYSAGFVEFYKHGTSEKYITYADWAGSFNPFRIPLNSQGRAVAIAEKDVILDMYVYNYLGNLAYSRLNVRTTEDQDGAPLRFTSSDGSVTISRVDNVVDLQVHQDEKIYGTAEADSVSSNGVIEFDNVKSGNITVVSAGTLRIGLEKLYHVTVALEFNTATVNPNYCDCQLTDSENTVHKFTLDASRTKQMIELSWDAVSSSDTFQITIQAPSIFTVTSAELYIHAVNPVVGGGSTSQVQSDWNVTDADSPAFIKNKPNFFIAQYGVTTYAEILAAYEAGVNVLCSYGSSTDRKLGILGYAYINTSHALASRNFEFAYFKPKNRDNQATTANQGIAEIETWKVYGNNSWEEASKPVSPLIAPGTGISTSYSSSDRRLTVEVSSAVRAGAASGSTAVQPEDLATVATSGSYDDLIDKPANLVQDASYVHTDNNFTNAEKDKLDGIEAGAEKNVNADWSATGGNSEILNKPENLVQDPNYVHTDNNFTNSDKSKLGNIEAGAEKNVQSDWNQTDSSADDYIKNKPSIETLTYTTDQEVTDILNDLN